MNFESLSKQISISWFELSTSRLLVSCICSATTTIHTSRIKRGNIRRRLTAIQLIYIATISYFVTFYNSEGIVSSKFELSRFHYCISFSNIFSKNCACKNKHKRLMLFVCNKTSDIN